MKINLKVNYDRSIANGIEAGKYESINVKPNYFPNENKEVGTRDITVEFIGAYMCPFQDTTDADEVIGALDKMGFRPVTLGELLAIGELYPELQLKFTIVALGSVSQISDEYYGRGKIYAYLSRFNNMRNLQMSSKWAAYSDCHFAVVSK